MQLGRRGRIETAATLTGALDTFGGIEGKTNAEGEFVADQATDFCVVPGEPAPSTRFFRVRLD